MSHVCKYLAQFWYVGGRKVSIIIIHSSGESDGEQADEWPNKIINDSKKCPEGWLRCVKRERKWEKEPRTYNGERKVSSINGIGKTRQQREKRRKVDHYLTPYTKINLKLIKDLNVRCETIKLLEENIGSMLFDISLSGIFLNIISPLTREIKGKS